MAIRIYNFDKFNGHAEVKDCPNHEFRIYFKENSNTLVTICSKYKDSDEFYLKNFILDKEHLQNLRKDKINWFYGISGLNLYVDKLTPDISKFISYALEYNVKVTLLPQEQWGEPIE